VNYRGCFLLFFGGLISAAAQEDGPVKMTPEFAFAFPVVLMNKHDVSVKYPVMINPVTVLNPGMILRVIYVPPIQSDSEDLVLAHKGNMEQSFSRATDTPGEQARMSPEMAHEIERQRRRVWEVPNNFVLAIAQYPTDAMHLIYSTASIDQGILGRKENLHDTSFSFFDGLFIGMPNGRIQVLGVETASRADQAGIKAGDEIVAVGSAPMHGDLNQFSSAYSAMKKTARDEEASTYPMTILSPGASAPRTVAVPMPLTIKSGLMDGFK